MDIVIWTRARSKSTINLLKVDKGFISQNNTLVTTLITLTLASNSRPPPPLPHIAAAGRRLAPPPLAGICSDQLFEENPSVLISSGLLLQADEGVSLPVVDLIDESTAAYREEPVFL
ncbi:hypothetical protein F511_44186 [Dorcoceras hygrometricum]|uniref:Uncharacterized protein n=1 Tax=Dorcoceras hygrometricum TaxID=472368 RepID=A0A2Z7CX12_9LAMI|nr:hypothetical protein F511_44186 [Dorcoceras hygrometricum]